MNLLNEANRMSKTLPCIVAPETQENICEWLINNQNLVEEQLDAVGAVLLRNMTTPGECESQFKEVVKQLSGEPLNYLYRSTPRTDLGGGVYTATEYPAGLSIPMHNENAYQRDWPLLFLFLCVHPADGGGGQTPLANTFKVTESIDPVIRKKFMEKNVMYIRNYHQDIDLPWQTVFQTESRSAVEQYCREHEIEFEWTASGTLRTWQVCQAFAKHPHKREWVWFNQAHLFHPSSQDGRTRALLKETFKEEELPRNAFYGDGSRIEEAELEQIRYAFNAEMITFDWHAGDVLVVDNMMVSHGRAPYKGRRRVVASMCCPYSLYVGDITRRQHPVCAPHSLPQN
jgi:alpha-ketoglutarate-dependent taurine dioxygenase